MCSTRGKRREAREGSLGRYGDWQLPSDLEGAGGEKGTADSVGIGKG